MLNNTAIGKDMEGSGHSILFLHLPGGGGLRKTTRNSSQDRLFSDRYLNPRFPEYEVGLLTTSPRLSVRDMM
jgi:hypothetical protein